MQSAQHPISRLIMRRGKRRDPTMACKRHAQAVCKAELRGRFGPSSASRKCLLNLEQPSAAKGGGTGRASMAQRTQAARLLLAGLAMLLAVCSVQAKLQVRLSPSPVLAALVA